MERFRRAQNATVTLQARVRSLKEARRVQEVYQQLRGSTICVQNLARRKTACASFELARRSAAIIQTLARMRRARKTLVAAVSAATLIQKWARVYNARLLLSRSSAAAVTLQSFYRQRTAQSKFMLTIGCAVMLQSVLRASQCRQRYLARQDRRHFFEAARTIQCAFRCRRAKIQLLQMSALIAAAKAKKEELLTAVEIVQASQIKLPLSSNH